MVDMDMALHSLDKSGDEWPFPFSCVYHCRNYSPLVLLNTLFPCAPGRSISRAGDLSAKREILRNGICDLAPNKIKMGQICSAFMYLQYQTALDEIFRPHLS